MKIGTNYAIVTEVGSKKEKIRKGDILAIDSDKKRLSLEDDVPEGVLAKIKKVNISLVE